jgi:hypothetical protein
MLESAVHSDTPLAARGVVGAYTDPVPEFHLAQVNIGRAKAPMDAPLMAGFVGALDEINALADSAPGFVWRLQTEDGDATAIRPYAGDESMLINMSVWESIEQLAEFVYRSDHVAVMRQRKQWFETIKLYLALWWVPAGHLPTVGEAVERLEHLRRYGPTPYAFTFKRPFAAGDGSDRPAPEIADCPA